MKEQAESLGALCLFVDVKESGEGAGGYGSYGVVFHLGLSFWGGPKNGSFPSGFPFKSGDCTSTSTAVQRARHEGPEIKSDLISGIKQLL